LELRLSEARRRAIDSAQSVQEIALACGFTSQASLARAFRQAFGQSISALRRHH
jgi:AraC-like DNA-binding protein